LSPHEDQNKIIDRQVTITGTPEAQWKSQYYIYDKIRQEGYIYFLCGSMRIIKNKLIIQVMPVMMKFDYEQKYMSLHH
jgi:hypothetical protein